MAEIVHGIALPAVSGYRLGEHRTAALGVLVQLPGASAERGLCVLHSAALFRVASARLPVKERGGTIAIRWGAQGRQPLEML